MLVSVNSVPRPPVSSLWKVAMVVTATLTLGCCLWVLWADVTAFEDVETLFSAGVALVIPLVAWLVLAPVGLMRYAGWWRVGLLVPLFVASTLALTWFDVPGRIGWAASRGAMDRAAEVCNSLNTSTSGSSYYGEKIGVYQFHRIERESDGKCRFHLLRDYPVVRSGFLYVPNGGRFNGLHGHTYYVPLGGYWHYYQWAE